MKIILMLIVFILVGCSKTESTKPGDSAVVEILNNTASQQTLGSRYYTAFSNLSQTISQPPVTDIQISANKAISNQLTVGIGQLTVTGETKPIVYSTSTANASIIGDILLLTNVPAGVKAVNIVATDSHGLTFSKSININVANATVTTQSGNNFISGYGVLNTATNTSFLDFESSWTVSALVKPSVGDLSGTIFSNELPNTGNTRAKGVSIKANQGQIDVLIAEDYPVVTKYNLYRTYDKIPANVWNHIVIVHDSTKAWRSRISIYVNGIKYAANAAGSTTAFSYGNNGPLSIGAIPTPNISFQMTNGSMDEVSFWDVAFSLSDISNIVQNINSSVHAQSAHLRHRYQIESTIDGANSLTDTGLDPLTLTKQNAGGSMINYEMNVIGH